MPSRKGGYMLTEELLGKDELKSKLLNKREIDGECWVWIGWWHPDGYGCLQVTKGRKNRKSLLIHRIAAHIWLDIPLFSKHFIVHKKECPHRACFNPEHLIVYKNRKSAGKWYSKNKFCRMGENVTRATLTLEKALDIRDAIIMGERVFKIMERLGVSRQQVQSIKSKRCWKYIWQKCFDKNLYEGKFGDKFGLI